jgi:energy-coupling factor transporter ATP-binding protein EcfA2
MEPGAAGLKVRITQVTVSDGRDIPVPENGVVLLVGPNNAGKSQFLRDITGIAKDPSSYRSKVLTAAKLDKHFDGDFSDWVSKNLPQVTRRGIPHVHVEGWGDIQPSTVVSQWNTISPGLSSLTSIFVLHADGESRLTAGDPQSNIDFSTQVPTHPLQKAYIRPEIEDALSSQALAAFGTRVTVDRYAGARIALRIGTPPVLSTPNGAPTTEYLDQLKALPPLQEQGDGVRSYLGLLLHMLGSTQQIILVDEPEAFLHPPQARQLGSVLAERTETRQSFIATHSADVLQGVLQAETQTTIVRITRSGNVNHAAVLDHTAVDELWSDPLLRYSNLMDGLFHDAVVLCEGDADCRYYGAVLESLNAAEDRPAEEKALQLLFTHCGGKARMASVIRALRSAGVPVVVVADFDVLKDKNDVEKIVSALDGDFSVFEGDLRIVDQSLLSDSRPLRKTALRDEMMTKIDAIPNELVSPSDVAALRPLLHADNGWDKAKRAGVHAITQGDASAAGNRLLEALAGLGVLVVPVGELERFVQDVPGHGPAWVTAVLENNLHKLPGPEATDFVIKLRTAAARVAANA